MNRSRFSDNTPTRAVLKIPFFCLIVKNRVDGAVSSERFRRTLSRSGSVKGNKLKFETKKPTSGARPPVEPILTFSTLNASEPKRKRA